MKQFFAILGGMGTMATESFIHLLNDRTIAHCDQEYLNYLVLNHATVPDRTAYILGKSEQSPLPSLLEDIQMVTPLNPDFLVLTCNTAHYFYDDLQAQTSIPIIHMPRLAVAKAVEKSQDKDKPRVIVLATSGTIQSGVYAKEFEQYPEVEMVIPQKDLQDKVMSLIYDDIKENDHLNEHKFNEILQEALVDYQCDVAILGCTELSLMQEHYPDHGYTVVDAQSELADEVLKRQQG